MTPQRIRSNVPLLRVGLVVIGLLVLVEIELSTGAGGPLVVKFVDDLGQFVAAAFACVCAVQAAVRSAGRLRLSWTMAGIGAGAWAVGEVVWCWYELVERTEVPSPSPADVGFLIFPVGACLSLWLFPTTQGLGARRRSLLDGFAVVAAIFAISWSLTLGAETRASDVSNLGFGVTIAYPIGDVLVLTMVVFAFSRPTPYRSALMLMAGAMGAMAVADSGFAYLTATGLYTTGSPIDLGWFGAFALLGFAALRGTGFDEEQPEIDTSRLASATPYVPMFAAIVVIATRYFLGHKLDMVEFCAMGVSLTAVLVRQYLTVRENGRLLTVVAAREEQLRHQAFYDKLTGLANRALFTDRVAHALELHHRDLRSMALLFFDLDDFKAVNDTFGHAAGDELLIRVAERLRGVLRSGDTLARFGGDEFAVLIEDRGEPAHIADRIVAALRIPFSVGGSEITIGVSIGLTDARSEPASLTVEGLLSHADIAMYAAKRGGKDQIAVYEPSMAHQDAAHLRLREPLRQAIDAGEITAVFQPIIGLASGMITGFEALARWQHEGRLMSPDEFIPLAARAGLLRGLTDHMLDRACRQMALWSARTGNDTVSISVNVPPVVIVDHDFPRRVAAALERSGLPASQLVLEITEDALLDDIQAAKEVTRRLRDLGSRVVLDDFGTGYSSLVHLQQMPLTGLKIDRTFIANIDQDPAAEAFLKVLLGLGVDLGLSVTAEGVERTQQAEVLQRLGCPFAQGYLFGRPQVAEDLDDLLQLFDQNRDRAADPHQR